MLPGPFRTVVIAGALLLPGPAHAQDTLEGALKDIRPGGFALLTRREDSAAFAAQWDEAAVRLRIEGHVSRIILGPLTAAKLWKSHGWGNQGAWILVTGKGEELEAGTGILYGARVLSVLRDQGLAPRWEARRAFLREHPENGDAWAEEMFRCVRAAFLHMNTLVAKGQAVRQPGLVPDLGSLALAEPDPEARERLADQIFGEVADALAGARAVEGWWRIGMDPSGLLGMAGARESPRIRDVCAGLVDDLEQAYARGESGFMLESRLAGFCVAAGRPLRELPEWVALPGLEQPSFPLMLACLGTRAAREDWEGILAFLDGPALNMNPLEPLSPAVWESRCMFKAVVAALRVAPLWALGRGREAREAVAEARLWSGDLTEVTTLVGPKIGKEAFFQEAMKEPALPRPPMPSALPPPRLALLGVPPWKQDWDRLRASADLLPWSPAELPWTSPAPAEAAAVRARGGWGPEPRWALLLGDEPVASGTRCPSPALLAGILGRERPSILQRLDRILERHPGHIGAHRARMEQLKARMPEPRLESLLAEDARAAFLPAEWGFFRYALDFGPDAPWNPDPALWQWSAQQVLPRLETLLRSWPSQPAVWKAWLAWARFHPAHPSVVALASTLVLWMSQDRMIGLLPLEALRAVTEELRRDRNYPELARWLGTAWEARRTAHPTGTPLESWEREGWEALREPLIVPLVETLRLCGQPDQALDVEKAYRAILAP